MAALKTQTKRYLRRELESQALKAARSFPAVVLTGPRRAGKTVLLRHLFPSASYYLLEDPDVVSQAVAPGVRALPWQEFLSQGLA